jgi:parvulin-like peptidyl-prolyl isomerase
MTRRLLATIAVALAAPAAAQEGGFIPPRAAVELAIPRETLRRVDELAFQANEAIVGLEAAVRRAQIALDRELRSDAPDEARAQELVDAVARAETAVRKNRVVLLIRVRKVLGDELWQRLEAWRAEHAPPWGPRPGGPPGPGGPPPGGPRPPR